MKKRFYPRFAVDGIRKNSRMYVPYLLTCILTAAAFYILSSLWRSPIMENMRGGTSMGIVLMLGSRVIAVFAAIFLLYTNSFLIRRRKREFGLYNILGMNKRNIGRILFWESLIVGAICVGCGLAAGILLSKLAELGLVRIVLGTATFDFYVSWPAVRETVILFLGIFAVIYLISLGQVRFSNPMDLVRSESMGEKPPKANWFFGLLGVVILGVAYYVAVTIESPLEAITWFFVAVIMVIVATYLLMISGSVLLCRVLQRRKDYYYRKEHFVSVSSMAYRMKRNGAGLASICILVTMVLVMISSTSCLYFGADRAISSRFPRDLSVSIRLERLEDNTRENVAKLRGALLSIVESAQPEDVVDFREAHMVALVDGNNAVYDDDSVHNFNTGTYSKVTNLYFITLDDYNAMEGTSYTLQPGQALLCGIRTQVPEDTLTVEGITFHVAGVVDSVTCSSMSSAEVIPSIFVVIPELEDIAPLARLQDSSGNDVLFSSWNYYYNTGLDADGQIEMYDRVREELGESFFEENPYVQSVSYDSLALNKAYFYGMYGGLFFLGIVLSIVFLVAAVLILYYKQVCEGYEDQSRFTIMQNVGMTRRDIRRSINSQMLTVFFLPLGMAVLHLGFAFPMIYKLLALFYVSDLKFLLLTTAVSVLVFAVFYVIVYRATSNAYYAIVSEREK